MSGQPIVDVVIIGGGPAGSSLASYLAMAGVECIIFEKEVFPRPHVGESLVPSSTRVFKEIGFLDKMEEAGFPHKYGAAWTTIKGEKEYNHDWEGLEPDSHAELRFDERVQEGVDKNYTYHVDRGLFDLMLLRHAEELGATTHESVRVQSVKFSEDGGLHTVKFVKDGVTSEVNTRLVVDASGRQTFLGNKLKLKVMDPVFDQYSIHTWFEGFDRKKISGERKDYNVIHFLPISNSWVWQIPITDEITSIGVVTQKKNFARSKASRERFFWECIGSRPEVEAELRESVQLRPFTPEGDYSYAMKQITGDGWLLIGDAARFIDPIFSSGISVALNSARFAKQDIIEALRTGDLSRSSFQRYETIQNRGARNWYEFITLYYRLNALFTAFIIDPKYRLEVLKLLQGDVYNEDEPAVLGEMRRIVTAVEQDPNHLLHKWLGDLTADAYKPVTI